MARWVRWIVVLLVTTAVLGVAGGDHAPAAVVPRAFLSVQRFAPNDTHPLQNSCFDLYADFDEDGVADSATPLDSACDADSDGGIGTVFEVHQTGYVVVETVTADGCPLLAPPIAVVITAHDIAVSSARLDIVAPCEAVTDASLVVRTVNYDGNVLANACYQLSYDRGNGQLGQFVASICDRYDANPSNGSVTFNLGAGNYILWQHRSPKGYLVGKQVQLSIAAGATKRLDFKVRPGGVLLRVYAKNPHGDLLANTCFGVNQYLSGGGVGKLVAGGSDGYDGPPDGDTELGWLAPGDYWLVPQSGQCLPAGYLQPSKLMVHIPSDRTSVGVTVVYPPIVPPGTLIVTTRNIHGLPLPGACFAVFASAGGGHQGSFVASSCDGNDGSHDGKTVISDIPPGPYVLLESRAPSGYVVGAARTFTMPDGEAKYLTIVDQTGGIPVRVKTINEEDDPVPGVCYQIRLDAGGGAPGDLVTGGCDGDRGDGGGSADGIATYRGLPPGDYVLINSSTPLGYRRANGKPFTITADQTSRTITIRLKLAPGPNATSAEADDGGSPNATDEPTRRPRRRSTEESPAEPTAEATVSPSPEPTEEATSRPRRRPTEAAGDDGADESTGET